MIQIVTTKGGVRDCVATARRRGESVALVPTMGALHDGHISLIEAARAAAGFVVVSIFVNPTQFGANDDFDRYPRDLDGDIGRLELAGANVAFAPEPGQVYPEGTQTSVVPGKLAERWEGEVRPGHFEGVATVVAKLLNIVGPDAAYFGEKDYQQLRVIEQMARDLDFALEVVGCPVIRDSDGLALSSRNEYLTEDERRRAAAIPHALEGVADAVSAGETDVAKLEAAMRGTLETSGFAVDYAVLVDPATLEPLEALTRPARVLVAARIGRTRLIDNSLVTPPG
ncbi:MAG: pantoate--beta-alanine ligase [Coriobacteriales bacterium]|nr:pantoate--beta-alanine ligase [Coriobacteriales bacterium]